MRSIGDIRREAIRRESKVPELNPKAVATETKPLIQDTVLLAQKAALNKGLSKAIEKKQAELKQVSGIINKAAKDVTAEADRIVADARKVASKLIGEAQDHKNRADKLLSDNQKIQTELNQAIEAVMILKTKIEKQQEDLDIKIDGQHLEQLDLDRDKAEILKLKSETEANWTQATATLLVAIEQLQSAEKLETEVFDKVAQTLVKAGTIISSNAALVKIQDAKEKQLDQKAQELQQKEKLLTDRRHQLDRVASEIKQKNAIKWSFLTNRK